LIQQKVASQPKSLDIEMKLEASTIGDGVGRGGGVGAILDTVSFLENLIRQTYKREGEARTNLVYQV
jgi:hypothetical protein